MARVLTALVLIPVVLLVVFKAPLWVFALVLGAFALGSAYEYLALAAAYNKAVSRYGGLVIIFVFYAMQAMSAYRENLINATEVAVVIFIVFVGYALLLLAASLHHDDFKDSLPSAALGFFVIPYILVPFATMLVIRTMPSGWFFMLFLFVMVWSGDIFAYYVGKNFGKHLLAPRVSPKKTWEGTVASLVGCILISMALCWYAPALEKLLNSSGILPSDTIFGSQKTLRVAPFWLPAVLALIVNIVSQAGDLVESMLKRGADVKDSGHILPGHGGLLDRVDALLFAAPVAMLLFLVTGKYFVL